MTHADETLHRIDAELQAWEHGPDAMRWTADAEPGMSGGGDDPDDNDCHLCAAGTIHLAEMCVPFERTVQYPVIEQTPDGIEISVREAMLGQFDRAVFGDNFVAAWIMRDRLAEARLDTDLEWIFPRREWNRNHDGVQYNGLPVRFADVDEPYLAHRLRRRQ